MSWVTDFGTSEQHGPPTPYHIWLPIYQVQCLSSKGIKKYKVNITVYF